MAGLCGQDGRQEERGPEEVQDCKGPKAESSTPNGRGEAEGTTTMGRTPKPEPEVVRPPV